jgi:polysaccharide deacetylase family protein (PEP-CTERM system associated)
MSPVGRPDGQPVSALREGGPARPIANALTCDVEDYFQVSAFAPHIERASWTTRDCRVERNVDRLLELFARHGARGTFFTLGWIAERYPRVVRAIVAGGHELASHGYGHLRASEMSHADFVEDITSAKKLLEDIGGVPVHGYRAPSFSIGHANLWAFDALVEAGYRYSSSVYPVRHDHYGMPDAPRFPYQPRPELVEIPVTTTRLFGNNVPTGGGGYFRFFPYRLSEWMIRRVNRVDGQPAIFYFHPWEIDPGQPRVPGVGFKTRFRHYVNLHRTEARLAQLLRDFRWERVDVAFGAALGQPAVPSAGAALLPAGALAA